MVKIELGGLLNGKPVLEVLNSDGEGTTRQDRITIRQRGSGNARLSWDNQSPRLVLTSDTTDFDTTIIEHFMDEGFQVAYLPYTGDKKDYNNKLQHLADPLDLGDKYAIVAYGDAAALCLDACMKPMQKLVALIAYYPPYMPNTSTDFPPSLLVSVHLAASQKFGTRHPHFRYPGTVDGFAEHDLEEYDKVEASLAWSRTLGTLRRAFSINIDLDAIWEEHTRLEFAEKNADATMKTMVAEPYVNHVPTMTGGIGYSDLRRFYADYFIPGNPPDMAMKLLSRTEVPWMLPGVPPTGKKVEATIVAVVCVRGGKLYHEHIYWDQASVLVQVGLLDPTLVPKTFKTTDAGKEKEVKRLPVVGAQGAWKVVDEKQGKSNELIAGW